MGMLAPVAAIAALLAAAPVYAFDVAQADIIGLRLGMSDSDVEATLRRQGFGANRTKGVLQAKTRDGLLTIEQAERYGVSQIRYVFRGGNKEAEMIERSLIDHFGPPQRPKPLTWCQLLERDNVCRRDAASLTYLPDTLTLTLQAGSLDQE
jgi:hypothetical protein